MARTHAGRGKPATRISAIPTSAGPAPPPAVPRALRGYLAAPEGDGPFPAVLMIHEAFGLDDITVRHADRMAAAGYLTLAVDLFSDGGARRCLVATMRALSAGEGRAFTDLATARDWLWKPAGPPARSASSASAWAAASPCCWPTTASTPRRSTTAGCPKDPEEALAGACPIVATSAGRTRTLPGGAAKLEQHT